jgi:hypothetical protein
MAKKYSPLRSATWLLPILAIGVFLNEVYRQNTKDLTAWKGGGMGMFATVDGPGMRFINISLSDIGRKYRVTCLNKQLRRLRRVAEIEPSKTNIKKLADSVLQTKWRVEDRYYRQYRVDSFRVEVPGSATIQRAICPVSATVSHASDLIITPQTVRVEFWKTNYEKKSGSIFSNKWRSVELLRKSAVNVEYVWNKPIHPRD